MLRLGVGLEGNGSRMAPTGVLRYLEELQGGGEASWSSGVNSGMNLFTDDGNELDSPGNGREKGIYYDEKASREP